MSYRQILNEAEQMLWDGVPRNKIVDFIRDKKSNIKETKKLDWQKLIDKHIIFMSIDAFAFDKYYYSASEVVRELGLHNDVSTVLVGKYLTKKALDQGTKIKTITGIKKYKLYFTVGFDKV